MSPERPTTSEHDPYWTDDVSLFEGSFHQTHGEPRIVRARIHRSDERYWLDAGEREIVPIRERTGTRTHVQMEAYLPTPDFRLTVALAPASLPDSRAGTVIGSAIAGMHKRPLGKSQAWYYPTDTTLLLWEAFLEEQYRDAPLRQDANMRRLWRGLEDSLTTRFPTATRMTTPFDDPLFATAEYQAFLRDLGYAPVARAAFGKVIERPS